MRNCDECLHSRLIVSENGFHSACCLSYKKAMDCMTGKKDYFATLNLKEAVQPTEEDLSRKNPLTTLPQYHFDRNEFCKVFEEVFTWDEYVDIDVECGANRHLDEFSLFRWEDEFYILHRNSGVMINWYKHMGRTNTCNKPDFTLDDFRYFLQKLREDLVWEGVIKDEVLYKKIYDEWYGDD